jgi:hypothetical protein
VFGKKKINEPLTTVTKEQELGPRPADIPVTEELKTFEVLLRSSLPSIKITAHAHDFGGPSEGGDGSSSGSYTHFIIRRPTTWTEKREHKGTQHFMGGYREIYQWRWVPVDNCSVVFAIRTADVLMVSAVDNVEPVHTETLALGERFGYQEPDSYSRLRADGVPVINGE